MAPFMFGYQIEFGRFPYLTDGPVSITPFILSVQCLLAAERIPQFRSYCDPLAGYVTVLLRDSPAESWQNIAQSRESRNTDDANDVLDPELGIGPEEIVGACILATYGPKLEQGDRANIAESAFKWARGWIKVSPGQRRYGPSADSYSCSLVDRDGHSPRTSVSYPKNAKPSGKTCRESGSSAM